MGSRIFDLSIAGLGLLAASVTWRAPVLAQDAGAGLIQRLQALEKEVSFLKERRFESGNLQIHVSAIPELSVGGSNCDSPSRGIQNGRVQFAQPFARTPKVIAGFYGFELGGERSGLWNRLRLDVLSVDQSGFDYNFITYCKAQILFANASWFAFMEN